MALPSLASMTLDSDDVRLARHLLRNREKWGDTQVVREYESAFARWNGSAFALSFLGGRVALSAAIYALGLKHGDEVIVPGYTCVVVRNAFLFAGVKVVFSDIELDTYGLDASQLQEKLTSRTKAVLLHHLYGLVCRDYDVVIDFSRRHGLRVIEDCAHATGAEYKGVKVGNRGDVGFYSSEQSKIFNTILGGIAVTNDPEVAIALKEYQERAAYPDPSFIEKQLRNVAISYYRDKHPLRWLFADFIHNLFGKHYIVSTSTEEEGGIRPAPYGRKMPAPIAAIGLNQLKKIDRYNQIRRENAKRWMVWCDNNGYVKPVIVPDSVPVFLRFPILVEEVKKNNTSWASEKLNVNVGIWFTSNLHPVHVTIDGCPKADEAVKRCINFPTLTDS